MNIPPFLEQKHYPSLDGFRALAILAVIFGHVFFEYRTSPVVRLFSGTWGVNFFFVISGFLITTLLIREKNRAGSISLSSFYIRRTLRIFPAAFFFLAVMVVLNAVYDLNISATNFLTAALYIKNAPISTPGEHWYLGHYWSLSAEEQYYLIVPAMVSIGYMAFRWTAFLLIGCAYFVATLVHIHTPGESEILRVWVQPILQPQIYLLIGSLTSLLVCERRLTVPPLGSIVSVLLILASLVLQSGLLLPIPGLLGGTLSAICLAILIVSSVQQERGAFGRLMNSRTMAHIGLLSYSLYIWQQIFTHKPFIIASETNAAISILSNLVLLFVVSSCSYYFLERYFLRLKAKFSRA